MMTRGLALLMILSAALPAAAQNALPDGAERGTVATVCTACHDAQRIVSAGHDRAGWLNVLAMMRNAGAKLPPDKVEPVADYLARHFPPRAHPEAVVLPGPVQVSIRDWEAPTPGSRPHDPLAGPDGSIWYTGQMADVLGRVDPAGSVVREYRLPQGSGPHGLVADHAGAIWFTANFAGYIGHLDPATGEVKRYPLPDPAARDPHTPIFDRAGILWFTVQNANKVGRLDPATGEIRLAESPTPHSNPYGMVIGKDGAPWFAEFGSNKIARIDPATLAIREYDLPDTRSRPRRIATTDDGIIWFTDYSRGYLGRLDPASGKTAEFASPGGPNAQPYGITAIGGTVWYSESGVSPNTLVRFDPAQSRFQSWTIPSGGGVVRNMMPMGTDRLVLACSGVNRVALVEIR